MLTAHFDALLVLLVLVAVFAAFISERVRPDVAAMGAALALVAIGILPPRDMLASFSNEAPVTVAGMFVLSAALERTGIIGRVGDVVSGLARRSPAASIASLALGAMLVSAFINNTPVVVILTPITIMLAQTLGLSASRFLIPLSYATIMGGTCTLIGTSTNIVVSGAAAGRGLEPFTLFEITPLGLILGVVGIAYLLLIGVRLLPDRTIFADLRDSLRQRQFLTDALVPLGSPLVGKTLLEADIGRKLGSRVVDVIRNRVSFAGELDKLTLRAGDRLVLRTLAADVMGLRDQGDVVFGAVGQHALEPIATQNTRIMEGIVGPRSPFVGRRLADLNLRRSLGVYILALHRHDENLRQNIDQVRLAFGDTILLEGPPEGLRRLLEEGGLVGLSEPVGQPPRRDRGWLAIGAILMVIVLASIGFLPISTLALLGAGLVVAGGCLDPDEAYQSVNWPILMLIFGMLAVGRAMEVSGAGTLIVEGVLQLVDGLGPVAVLCMVYLVTMLLTEFLSNNATAILLTPIVIDLAAGLGVDPRPFVVAVMFAASASFSTPIGYQTNTFVYGAGGYRFLDFVKVGVPLNILMWLLSTLLIPVFWPFG
ncbi:SLC13 family permease [Geminicoccaceae bacterium 1502E]|nr:SLC13 family permease [Geminicoccaceae bacterium 1502E]